MRERILHGLMLVALLMLAGYVRFSGLMWGDTQYQHPDERFLVWVTADLAPVQQVGDYFNTRQSTLNPANRGHGFFVYGTLPVFATRYLADALARQPGWQEIVQVGRALSAASDLMTVLLVYLTAALLMRRRWALLAAGFNALAVLQIQQAHFFTVDSFATAFCTLAIYLAVRLVQSPLRARFAGADLWTALAFGAAVGMAMASKLNTAPVALLLPAALLLIWLRAARTGSLIPGLLRAAIVGGLTAFVVFRVCQPYAFEGPTFFHLKPDPAWMAGIREQRAQATGDVDFPPALQWARRAPWFSWWNLTVWGLGLPLGMAAWGGLLGMGWLFAAGSWRARSRAVAWLAAPPHGGLLLVWGWTVVYFGWQSLAWNATMRYQLPIYPTLTILAAWGLGALSSLSWRRPALHWIGAGLGGLVLALSLAWALAFVHIYQVTETRQAATTWIYEHVPAAINLQVQQPDGSAQQLVAIEEGVTLRLENSYRTRFLPNQSAWLTQIDLPYARIFAGDDPDLDARVVARVLDLQTGQPLAASVTRLSELGASGRAEMVFEPLWLQSGQQYGLELRLASLGGALQFQLAGPVQLRWYTRQALVDEGLYDGLFRSPAAGTLRRIRLLTINPPNPLPDRLLVRAVDGTLREVRLLAASGATAPLLTLDPPVEIKPGALYLASLAGAPSVDWSALRFHLQVLDEPQAQSLPAPVRPVQDGKPLLLTFRALYSGPLRAINLWRVLQEDPLTAGPVQLHLTLAAANRPAIALLSLAQTIQPAALGGDPRGMPLNFALDETVRLEKGETYTLRLSVDGPGALAIRGSAPANETDWDMGLPFRALGYDAYGGLYQRGLNLQMYWDDNPDKLLRFEDTLNQADLIILSSNRQWGTIPRVPERYPLSSAYYRHLLGCPETRDVVWCYQVAEVGDFSGDLGFDLVQVFTSYPQLGPLSINTQFAEEAFSVYDHPKVMIFKKRADYDPQRVQAILGAVNLDDVVRLTPKKAAAWPNLMLPAAQWAKQQAGGTWSELFAAQDAAQTLPIVWAAMRLWALLTLLGWLTVPIVRRALPGLDDAGYPLARLCALLLLAYAVWLAGSLGVAVGSGRILAALLALAAGGLGLGWQQRRALIGVLRTRWRSILGVEALGLVVFAALVAVWVANPAGWQAFLGAGQTVDLSYFTAVLKSSSFPPYDPWFAGGVLNVDYYAWVLVGVPVKLLGIAPALAAPLQLAAQVSLAALGAFSLGWNLLAAGDRVDQAGVAKVGAVAVLGGARTFWRAGLLTAAAGLLAWGSWAAQGAFSLTEKAWLTLPLVLLGLSWAGSALAGAANARPVWHTAWMLGLGALLAGSLRAANAAQQPVVLALMLAALPVGAGRRGRAAGLPWYANGLRAAALLLGLWAVSVLLFAPFHAWYHPSAGALLGGPDTLPTLGAYLLRWGLWLWIITGWLVVEWVDWMAATPYAALKRLRPYQPLFALAGLLLAAALVGFSLRGMLVAWVVLPLGSAGMLLALLRPDQPMGKRAALLLAAVGMGLSLWRSETALPGTLLAISAALGLAWLLPRLVRLSMGRLRRSLGSAWLLTAGLLLGIMVGQTLGGAAARLSQGNISADVEQAAQEAQQAAAIAWMQANLRGSPVIVTLPSADDALDGSRLIGETGLPVVIGSERRQRQQRPTQDKSITRRLQEVSDFYASADVTQAITFLRRYQVGYIIVGPVERANSPAIGLDKFHAFDGVWWQRVYAQGGFEIYRVLPISP